MDEVIVAKPSSANFQTPGPVPPSRRGSTASGTSVPPSMFTGAGGTGFKGSRRSSIIGKKNRSMASKTNTAMKQEPQPVEKEALKVLDARGVDVTPRPLVVDEKPMVLNVTQLAPSAGAADRPGSTSTTGTGATNTTQAAPKPAAPDADEEVSGEKEGTSAVGKVEIFYAPFGKQQPQADNLCEVTLTESETILIFDKPNNCISNDHEDAKAVEERNTKYKALLSLKIQSEKFSEAAAQTLSNGFKDKEVQESAKETHSSGTQVNDWGIFDAQKTSPEKKTATTSTSTGTGTEEAEPEAEKNDEESTEAMHDKLLASEELADALVLVDRSVVQNNHHKELLLYRDFQLFKELSIPEHKQPAIAHLWEFSCEATEGLNVSCMVWNKQQKDMLVVGYGAYAFTGARESNPGLIAVWSLRNPQYPEHIIKCKTGVTSMDFSSVHFNLLAVGMYDGAVSIYDLHSKKVSVKPIIESGHTSGKHSDPVWRTKWIHRGSERGEKLVSISTDGRITQWSIKKGLEHIDLMKLKRIQSNSNNKPAGKSSKPKNEAFISRRSSGMCFDFSPRDSSVYVAGTEEGNIHKCSCSYSEQYLESFVGHMGPVYQVIFSPFDPSVFLSSSADWSIKMWDEYEKQELLTFQSGTAVVNDVQWSPTNSTAFANVTKDGRLEIWDMEKSTLKPVVSYKDQHGKPKAGASPKRASLGYDAMGSPATAAAAGQQNNRSLNCLLFNPDAPVVAVGTDKGQVIIFRLFNVEDREKNKEKQTERLRNAMRDNIMRKGR
ncbi:WD repeat domain-containing protein [Chloropicon primus]|uniref:Dynein axonemal intermediate chain 4 n=1 Tax=Chloropicon primus TaxID=1764295 RepID=A0A5B8MG60_9CHLO|nr:WD repeat domain-containing protein [Chloropicon primus]UPQ97541.1 WD repeat domain-containing protein [Chloropicon primus]|eukprot:QDZ18330.1 WD repeat domain-containing protein [Chloropicon primus]